jgi:hypothetical protein
LPAASSQHGQHQHERQWRAATHDHSERVVHPQPGHADEKGVVRPQL